MLHPQCFDQVKRVAAFQPQIQNHEIGFGLLGEAFGVRSVIRHANAGEIRLLVDQLPETIARPDDTRVRRRATFWQLLLSVSWYGLNAGIGLQRHTADDNSAVSAA